MTSMHPDPSKAESAAPSRQFGNTVISWVASTTSSSVQVTVTLGGSQIQQQTLTPDSNEMSYSGSSGKDSSKGILNASFTGGGTGGQLYGDLSWVYQGNPGSHTGSIGSWGS